MAKISILGDFKVSPEASDVIFGSSSDVIFGSSALRACEPLRSFLFLAALYTFIFNLRGHETGR